MFENMTEAFVMGSIVGAAIVLFLYLGYMLLMMDVKSKIKEEVSDGIDRHKDIYHGDNK